MEWEKASVELGAELERLLTGFIAQKRTMFGCPAYFVNNNMFTGVKASMVFLRLSESDCRAVMEESDEITIFEPLPDFPGMRTGCLLIKHLPDQQRDLFSHQRFQGKTFYTH